MPSSTPGMKNGSHKTAPQGRRQVIRPSATQIVAALAAKAKECQSACWPAASALGSSAQVLGGAQQLRQRQTRGQQEQNHRADPAQPKPARSQTLSEKPRRNGPLDARPGNDAPAQPGYQEEWSHHQRPAQPERFSVIERGVETNPKFRRKDFRLQDGGDGKIIQGEHKDEQSALGQRRAAQRNEQPLQ